MSGASQRSEFHSTFSFLRFEKPTRFGTNSWRERYVDSVDISVEGVWIFRPMAIPRMKMPFLPYRFAGAGFEAM